MLVLLCVLGLGPKEEALCLSLVNECSGVACLFTYGCGSLERARDVPLLCSSGLVGQSCCALGDV